ncbi:MAG: hypothetical protein DYG94_03995 [Leptolyngbya sp. PLA3]|nr:hypothetical protein [Phycisphaerales bacterium]MCE7967892.1 hypothetical protein [Leptolyngbya sp. PL-A3]
MAVEPHSEAARLRAKLDMIIHYLERWDLHYHAHGADFRPPGWDITIQEMIWRLKDERPPPVNESGGSDAL